MGRKTRFCIGWTCCDDCHSWHRWRWQAWIHWATMRVRAAIAKAVGEVIGLQAKIDALRAENEALNEAVEIVRHDSWGQAGVIEKLEDCVAELESKLALAWQELCTIRAAINADPEESTTDEVNRVAAERDKLRAQMPAEMWERLR